MFVYVLTFIACLGTGADRCHTVELPWDGSLMQCMVFGQHAAAQWTSEHPGYALAPWLPLRERPERVRPGSRAKLPDRHPGGEDAYSLILYVF